MDYFQSPHSAAMRPAPRPTIALGWYLPPTGSLVGLAETSLRTELYSVDLDARRALIAPSVAAVGKSDESGPVRIRSIWLPSRIDGLFSGSRTRRILAFLSASLETNATRSLIIPPDTARASETSLQPRIRALLESQQFGHVRLHYGIDAAMLSREPRHLQQLLRIRHVAEEWDIDLALDLTGSLYPGWEAEAAVMKVLPRLAVVRLPAEIGQRTYAGRTVATLADQGFTGTISVSPTSPLATILLRQGATHDRVAELRNSILAEYDRRSRPAIARPRPADLPTFDRP